MIGKLCYLFTFIFSVLNLLNITNIAWNIVFMPSIIVIGLKLLLFAICFIVACFSN